MSRNYDGDKQYASEVHSHGGHRTEVGYERWQKRKSEDAANAATANLIIWLFRFLLPWLFPLAILWLIGLFVPILSIDSIVDFFRSNHIGFGISVVVWIGVGILNHIGLNILKRKNENLYYIVVFLSSIFVIVFILVMIVTRIPIFRGLFFGGDGLEEIGSNIIEVK
jgi:hypothetical protein